MHYLFKKLPLLKMLSLLKILLLLKVYRKFFLSCVLLFQLLGVSVTSADTLNIATASNFRPVLEQLSQTFSEQQNAKGKSHQINISSTSSGVIYAQILQGAPFQLFFSANESYPEKLVASGHGVPDTLATYAIGKLVLASRGKGSDLDGRSAAEILSKAKRIAIANPRTAPYGIAAMEVMESLGVSQESQPKLVVGNNIAQAWQFFHSGNADVSIVAESLLLSTVKEEQPSFFRVDLSPYLKHSVRQGRVAIKPMKLLTRQFLDFMGTPVAEKIIVDGGYIFPTHDMTISP